ncbi:MAG TPA: DNA recombination protein RmuC [Terracidiphilus sp.]|nr:DNA recombination protein RmuC [Terracidiphilus sp.]
MTPVIVAVLAVVVGAVVGFLLRGHSVDREKSSERSLAQAEKAALEQRIRDLDASLASAHQQIAQLQTESRERARFESAATERQVTIDRLTAELTETRNAAQLQQQQAATSSRTQAARISELEAQLNAEQKKTEEKIVLLETAKKTLADQFNALAADILDQKSKTFAEGSQKEIGTLLNPLREQIKEFREKVEKVQTESSNGVTELKTLVGTLGNLNQALTQEAHNLATALRRDTKMQGNWGETILLNILEKSGLQKGIHYTYQQSFVETDQEGAATRARQTDVVVNLPGGHHLVIDSKVSLNAYNNSVNAENEGDRERSLKAHLDSVRKHFSDLAGRNYQALDSINAPDFVVMFVPIEPAYLLALQHDEKLWFEAYQKKVLLCGPTTVLFVIRIVADLWRQEKQAQNVKDVMKRGALLYDKFVGFVSDLEKLGKNLESAKDSYGDAMSKLAKGDGNLVGQAEKLRKLGLRTTKSLPKALLDHSDVEEPTPLSIDAGEDAQVQDN